MSNIAYAEKIVLSNEGLSKKELVELVATTLNVSIPNARVYIYNVGKRLNKKVISQEVAAVVKRNAPKQKQPEQIAA
jgi:hypothetical protein